MVPYASGGLTTLSDEEEGRQGDFLAGLGNLQGAVRCYQRAHQIDPLDAEWEENLAAIARGTFSPPPVTFVRPGPSELSFFALDSQLLSVIELAEPADGTDKRRVLAEYANQTPIWPAGFPPSAVPGRGLVLRSSSDLLERVAVLLAGDAENVANSDGSKSETLQRLRAAVDVMARWPYYDVVAWRRLSQQLFEPAWDRKVWVHRESPWFELRTERAFGLSPIADAFGARVPGSVLDAEALAPALPRICGLVAELESAPWRLPTRCGLSVAAIPEQRRFLEAWLCARLESLEGRTRKEREDR